MFKKINKELFLIVFLFTVFIGFLQYFISWYHNFSDATHYLWIADKYAEKNWINAINTYWGPMISWLLLALNPFFEEPFAKFRFLQVAISLFCSIITYVLILNKTSSKKLSLLATIALIPAYVSYAWFYNTPDLLLLLWLLILLLYIDKLFNEKTTNLIKLSFIGAALFFTKSVGLYIFILVFIGKFLLDKNRFNKEVLSNYFKLGLFLIVFISPWVILISIKNKGFTLGTGSIHNYNMNSPLITPDMYGELGNPYHLGQLTNPTPANAFDACIEHMHQPYNAWENYNTKEKTRIYSKIIYRNILSARSMFFGLDVGFIFIIVLLIGFIKTKTKIIKLLKNESTIAFIFIANVLLYLPFFFMERYTWPGSTALFVLTIIIVSKIYNHNNNLIMLICFTFFIGVNINLLIKEIKYASPEKPITTEIWKSKGNLNLKRTVWLTSKEDKRLGLIKGMIYYNHGQYIGALFMEEKSSTQCKNELIKFNINHIITLKPLSKTKEIELEIKKILYKSATLCIYEIAISGSAHL
jgi:hypothetical protein